MTRFLHAFRTSTMSTRISAPRAYFTVVLASTFLQGSSFVSTKTLLNDMAPLWIASLRFVLASLSLLPFVWSVMVRQGIRLRDLPWPQLFVIGSLQTAGVMAFLNIGMIATTSSTAAILMASNPFVVVILARVFLGEQIAVPAFLGLLLAFAGVVVCIGGTGPERSGVGQGEVLVMLASCCWAISTVLNKKFDLAISPWVITFWQMLVGSAILAVIATASRQPISLPVTAYHWGALIWLAIPASTGAMGLWFAALRVGGSVQTSGFLFLCPLFAAIIAFGLKHQVPRWNEVAGGAAIAIGLYIMSRGRPC